MPRLRGQVKGDGSNQGNKRGNKETTRSLGYLSFGFWRLYEPRQRGSRECRKEEVDWKKNRI